MGKKIVLTKNICGGRARFSGTRIEICDVVLMIKAKASLEDICESYPGLTMNDITMARTWYTDNKSDVDADIASKKQ